MRKLLTVLLTCVMLMGFSLTAHAEISPSAKPVEEQEEEEEIPSSPKTGESEVLVCSMMTMCICAGVVTVALRKTR